MTWRPPVLARPPPREQSTERAALGCGPAAGSLAGLPAILRQAVDARGGAFQLDELRFRRATGLPVERDGGRIERRRVAEPLPRRVDLVGGELVLVRPLVEIDQGPVVHERGIGALQAALQDRRRLLAAAAAVGEPGPREGVERIVLE